MTIRIHDTDFFGPLHILIVPGYSGAPRGIVNWGEDGAAVFTDRNELRLLRTDWLSSEFHADVAVTSTTMETNVFLNMPWTYRVCVTNAGTIEAREVVLSHRLPENVSLAGARLGNQNVPSRNGYLTWTLEDLPIGGVVEGWIRVIPREVGGRRTGSFTVATPFQDPHPQDNSAEVHTDIQLHLLRNQPQRLPMRIDKLASELASGNLVALTSAFDPRYPGRLVLIQPPTGRVIHAIPLVGKISFETTSPFLEISDDGSRAYTLLEENTRLQRCHLVTGTTDLDISFHPDPDTPPVTIRDLAVLPGTSQSFAVVRESPTGADLVIYDQDSPRPSSLPDIHFVQPTDQEALLGVAVVPPWERRTLVRIQWNSEGPYLTGEPILTSVPLVDFKADDLYIYFPTESIFNPKNQERIGHFFFGNAFVPDVETARFFYQSNRKISARNLPDLTEETSWTFPFYLNSTRHLVRWGADGFAFTDADNLYLLRSDLVPLVPDRDTDGDQMPDTWEVQYHLDPNRNDAGEDYDHDGLTNIEEFLAGTDPESPVFTLALKAARSGPHTLHLRFQTVIGKWYVLERQSLLAPSEWVMQGNPIVGTGATWSMDYPIASTSPAAYFRIRLLTEEPQTP